MVGWFNRERFSPSTRFRYSFLTACTIAGFYLMASDSNSHEMSVFYQMTLSSLKRPILQDEDQELIGGTFQKRKFTIYSEGCIIPKLNPFDSKIAKYVKWPNFVSKCPMHNHPLLSFNASHIWLNKHNYKHYNVTGNTTRVRCCYKSFFRPRNVDNIYSTLVDDRIKYDPCVSFSDSVIVTDEFVRVECFFNKTALIDVQYYVFAFKKTPKMSSSGENNNGFLTNNSYSVLILGIDAVSRMNFHRTMPKTLSYLQSKDAVELLGYNKVGDNTFPNLVPMLLGIRDSELKDTCCPNEYRTFDNCPFVWNTFKRKGYLTAFSEEFADFETFNYRRAGFMVTPTDYYLHPFLSEARRIRAKQLFMERSCMGNRYFYKVLLDYVESLILTVQPLQLFGIFWEASMSHNYLNTPVVMDSSYVKLLKIIDNLNNTIVFLVSDHGIRYGQIRRTKQGRLEERLPFVYILTPESFRERYKDAYENLKHNVKRLTTPFDVHATLTDLADMSSINNYEIKLRSKESYSSQRSISLFLPIPGNRTCHSAGIEDHWCSCYSERKVDVTDKITQEAAIYIVSYINNLLRAKRNCAKLTLSKVVEGIEFISSVGSKLTLTGVRFLIAVQTSPGDGVFEATVYRNKSDHANLEFFISGTISRLNKYANQSHCVHNAQLKLYCYCK